MTKLTFLSGAQQDKRQTKTQEIPFQHNFVVVVVVRVINHWNKLLRECRVSIAANTQNLTDQGPEKTAVTDLVLCRDVGSNNF